jgi:hypothetical protein
MRLRWRRNYQPQCIAKVAGCWMCFQQNCGAVVTTASANQLAGLVVGDGLRALIDLVALWGVIAR